MYILIAGDDKPGKVNYFTQDHLTQIKKVVPDAEIVVSPDPTQTDKLLPQADILIYTHGHEVKFGSGKNLKWVHAASAGVTDLASELKNTEILLTNSSGVHPIPIAETVLGYILMFGRKLDDAYRNQITRKSWVRGVDDLRGFELMGKTLGIVGYGRIGAEVAKLAHGFGMKVVALEHCDKIEDPNISESVKNVDELLKTSDFVVDCLPLTDKTKGYFDSKKFKAMKNSASFINIGRGGTVVENDLIESLKNGTIAGAGLDVFEIEPLPDTSPLWDLENVILTPHISGWTPEYTNRVIDIFCKNLEQFLADKPMSTLVDKKAGY